MHKGIAWSAASHFTDNQDGTVTDTLTGLIWLKDPGCFAATTWAAAIAKVNQLANGSRGLSDQSTPGNWRMPDLNELETLVDASAENPALSNGNPFLNVSTAVYWTSTSY